MKESLRYLCDSFAENCKTFKYDCGFSVLNNHVAAACAFFFAAHKVDVNTEHVKESAGIILEHIKGLSYYNTDPLYATTTAFLALNSFPERLLENTIAMFKVMSKEYSSSSRYAAFAALFLEAMALSEEETDSLLKRSRTIYDCLKGKHLFLTDSNDIAFVLLLARSGKNIEDIMTETESTYRELKGLSSHDTLQLIALILTCSDKEQKDKVGRFKELYDAMQNRKPKFSTGSDLLVLAALSVLSDDTDSTVNEIDDVFNALEDKENYKGIVTMYDKYNRLLHAVMLVLADSLSEGTVDLAAASAFVTAISKYEASVDTTMY